jgi:hypothetical protein
MVLGVIAVSGRITGITCPVLDIREGRVALP